MPVKRTKGARLRSRSCRRKATDEVESQRKTHYTTSSVSACGLATFPSEGKALKVCTNFGIIGWGNIR